MNDRTNYRPQKEKSTINKPLTLKNGARQFNWYVISGLLLPFFNDKIDQFLLNEELKNWQSENDQ